METSSALGFAISSHYRARIEYSYKSLQINEFQATSRATCAGSGRCGGTRTTISWLEANLHGAGKVGYPPDGKQHLADISVRIIAVHRKLQVAS